MAGPYVITALRQKRAEISGEIVAAEKRLAQFRADLDNVDYTLRLFDPTLVPSTIKPRLKRKVAHRFKPGQMTRSLLTILRKATGPLTVREIAVLIASEYGLDASRAGLRPLVANVRCALARPREGVVCSTRDDGIMIWGTR